MEPQERAAAPSRWQGEDEMNGPDGQTGPSEARGQSNAMSPLEALQLDFQDSHLSPALPLLPLTSGLEHSVTGCSFFQQGDPEFAPLRAFPDVSVASERFHPPLRDSTAHSSEQSSLSQHPLAQTTLLSDEGADDSLSAGSKVKQEEMAPLLSSDATANTPQALPGEGGKELESQALPDPTDGNAGGIHGDETFFLREDVPARQLLDLLQKEVGMQSSSSSSAVSSESQTSTKSKPRPTEAYKGVMFERQGPPGEASPSQQQEKHQEMGNITSGSRRTQPDDSSEELHRQLLYEVRRLSSREATEEPKGPTPAPRSVTPSVKESRGKWSETPFPAGSEWVHRERHLWSSKKQTGSDDSYLGFLPQSQSTPAVFLAPFRFKGEAKPGRRFAVGSNDDVLYRSGAGTASAGGRLPDSANQRAEDALQASDKVHSLPSFNYLQKVDAWRTKASSERTPPLESPALHRLSGVSPERKGDEAGSDAPNQGLTQQALRQPSTSHDAPQIPSSAPSGGPSPGRGEAVGGAPSDLENKGPAAPPSASPLGRSQSLSSLSTVVMSADKRQQTNVVPGTKTSQSQTDAPAPPGAAIQPSALDSLGHFSDVSADREPSSSLDSYAEVKVGPSVGTSSVVSLELDNYAPYWTFKRPTASPAPPPGPKELNIDERIPLYLQNLGIDQTPSKILTPFAPRGPIREPEFSPTDLCTIKGSSGSPSKSTQPSEGSSPHKGEFSRSSILSADSSISIPYSLDSLGPAAYMSEQFRARTSVTSDPEGAQRESRPLSCSQPDEPSHSSMLHPLQQQQQDSNQIDHRSESTSVAVGTEGNLALQNGGSTDQDAENSFVSARALSDIRKLLSQAENMISTGSSTASSGPNAPHLFSGKDTFRPPETKASRLLSSSFSSSSSTGGDLKSHSSLPWARSSSDSMLTSEKSKQSSSARESLTSSWPPGNPSNQAISVGPQGGAASNGAGTSVMSKSARRTEPEGCSAAPPDKTPTLPVAPAAAGTQQLSSASADGAGVPEEEEEQATPGDPGAESRSSSPVLGDADQGGMSDGSSESSLAVRVAKLLQNESPATMASSTPSVTDQEEGKAREWIQSKVSGRQCEPLRLDAEDRRRIEEIKSELLLRNPMKPAISGQCRSHAQGNTCDVCQPCENKQFPCFRFAV
ncbi:cell wall protein RBR3-like [Fundulus heteroclitus]|uniref:cell wall protein RBR3-like n=1 Tax=Fundulus heteroclitus TaxID=8078 RepID=UPI00165CCC66|nr:cell wall protein RBR3-like [Fundulus heteroclitus]